MTVTFKRSQGNTRVFGKIDGVVGLTKAGLRQGMFESGHGLIKRANNEIIHGLKTGRVYVRKVNGRKRRHKSSAPGETHANMSGAARRSLSFQLRGSRQFEFGYGVSVGKTAPEYVESLEFGNSRMDARPTLQNAIKAEQGNMVGHFEDQIERQFK